jgi:two-component system, LuxR family, sensor kinase FixL
VNAAIVHTKGLGRGLYPVELETNGLAAALQELASQTEAVFRVPCTVETDATALAALDSEAEINLYRIAQEALTNAVKHGKASKISVRLASESGGTTLVVKDDGVGVSDTPTQQGMGLRIMNYRARVIGASLALSRSREGGTVVACTVARKP